MHKLQDQNKKLKGQVESLSQANLDLAHKFGSLKKLIVQYEQIRMQHFWEAESFIQQLAQENQNLRLVLQLG